MSKLSGRGTEMEGVETGSRERADNTQAGFDGDARPAGDGRVLDAFHGMEGRGRVEGT